MIEKNEKYFFEISTGLKNLIGKELIVTDNIAIFELVKNSYDAYAKKVEIAFLNITLENPNQPSRIIIYDDGEGMSKEDILKKWLFVGFSDKNPKFRKNYQADYRDKIQEKRFFAGAKGIGRFSCDRLGKKLRMFTKKEDGKKIHILSLDWQNFEEDQEKKFQSIKVDYSEVDHLDIRDYIPTKPFKKGTILEISELNDKWERKKLLKLKQYMQRLINPSSIDGSSEIQINLLVPEFKKEDNEEPKKPDREIINGPVKNVVFEKLGIKTTEITCEINEDGEKLITTLADKGKFIFKVTEKNYFPTLKAIKVKIFYLNREAKTTFTKLMGIQPVHFGSIFLYKNRFRIHPYGNEDDDWLGIERKKGQGYRRFLSSREIMGRVEIIGEQDQFKEVTNREGGVIKNEYSEQLINFIQEIPLKRLTKYVVEALEWDSQPRNPDNVKQDSISLIEQIIGKNKDDFEKEIDFNPELLDIYEIRKMEKIPEFIDTIRDIVTFIPDKSRQEFFLKQIESVENELTKKAEIEKELAATRKSNLFLESALSKDTDLSISMNHSIKHSADSIRRKLKKINENITQGVSIEKILPIIDLIDIENERIWRFAKYASLATFDTDAKRIDEDIVQFVKEYLKKISDKGEWFQTKYINDRIITKWNFPPLDLSIILDNLCDNSNKAGATTIIIKFEKKADGFHILFSDNGNGVDEINQKFIFNRGFSLTGGSGIGLFHVKKILDDINGEIKFIGNNVDKMGKGACFEVIFR
jgi:signal transduction histidine kinase